ncbi:recombination protein NinB [Phenylobacterium deserti]|uniref:Recombination protein NinB n=1 Tax=Phenylobacterium deserti TaxID=1914756 RepID=A0A328AGX4_9CAUL|nr:recombination protein NinB [Phenylobacterium deserti]RAK52098.1 recombination protein NinB [Phenylobacterium deserti]
MSRVLFRLINRRERQRAMHFLTHAPDGALVEFKRDRRTTEQNSALWARLTDVAQQVEWYGAKLTPEDWKDVFTASLRKARVVPGLDAGTYVPLGMRTSDMTKEELSDLLELIAAFGAQHGVQFHDSDQGRGDANNVSSEAA